MSDDTEDAGVVLDRVDGGDRNGDVIVAGTRPCTRDEGRCQFATDATPLRIDGLREARRSFFGIIGDAGPGASTVSADGGVLLFEWPTVDGREFASPAVGETIEVRLAWSYQGEGCPVGALDVVAADGRLLVSQGLNGYSGSLFELSDEPAGQACSFPEEPDNADCCCATLTPVLMTVHSDPPEQLAECEEAVVTVDARPMFVRIWGAARYGFPLCGDDGDFTRASGLAIAVVE